MQVGRDKKCMRMIAVDVMHLPAVRANCCVVNGNSMAVPKKGRSSRTHAKAAQYACICAMCHPLASGSHTHWKACGQHGCEPLSCTKLRRVVLALQATSKEQSIRIASSGGLSEDQIEKMVREAESNAEKDKAVSCLLLTAGCAVSRRSFTSSAACT